MPGRVSRAAEPPVEPARDLALDGVADGHPLRRPGSRAWSLLTGMGGAVFLGLLGLFLYLVFSQTVPPGSAARDTRPGTERPDDRPRPRIGRSFDGLDEHVSVPHEQRLDPPQLTLASWLRIKEWAETAEVRRWVVGKNVHEHTEGCFGLVLMGKKAGAFLNIGGGEPNCFQVWSAGEVMTLDDWHHLAMTYDGKFLKVYFDGAEVGHREVNRPRVPRSQTFTIGRRPDGAAGTYFKGWLDDIRLYSRALPAEEVKAMVDHPSAVPGPSEGPVRYWRY